MKITRLLPVLIVSVSTVCSFTPAAGADDPPPPPTKPEATAAARELFRTMGGTKMADTGAEVMISAVRSNPQLAPYEDVFVAWYKKTMARVDLESKMVALYAETFTEKELKDLTAFYRGPLGRKALQKMPELMRRGAEIGTAAAKDNQAELERMLEVRRKEIEEKDKQAAKDAWTTPKTTPALPSTPTPAASKMK